MRVICDLSLTSAPMRSRSWTPAALFAGGAQGAWYDPSDPASLFQDVGGTVPVTSDGDPVALILDLSGNDNHAVQDVAPARPTWRRDGALSWLEYDGADDRMVTPPAAYSDPKLSICAGLQYLAGGNAWGSLKSAAGSVVYVGLSSPVNSGPTSNCGGQTYINRTLATNDRIALRTSLLNKSVVSVRDAQSASFTTGSTFVAYSGTPPPSALLFGYIEIEGATSEMIEQVEQWMARKTGVAL